MLRPSAYLEKLEDKLVEKCGPWFERHKAKFPIYIPLGLLGWYFYGMFLNSIRLGTPPRSTRRARRWAAFGCLIPCTTGSCCSRPSGWAPPSLSSC